MDEKDSRKDRFLIHAYRVEPVVIFGLRLALFFFIPLVLSLFSSKTMAAIPVPDFQPSVIETFPRDGAKDVPLDTKVMAVFSQPMLKQDVNEFTVTLNDGLSDISTRVSYNDEVKKLVLVPEKNLSPDRTYFVTISGSIRNSKLVPLGSDVIWKFRTVSKKDTEPPVIVDVSPTIGATGVPCDTKIELLFSKKMDDSSINEETLILSDNGDRVICSIRSFKDSNRVLLIPLGKLEPKKRYTVTAKKEIRDASGNHLEEDRTWFFTTGELCERIQGEPAYASSSFNEETSRIDSGAGSLELTPRYSRKEQIESLVGNLKKKNGMTLSASMTAVPEIIEVYPAPGTENIPLDARIRIRFSNPMKKEMFTIFTVSLQENQEFIFGSVEYDSTTRAVTFTPAGKLKASTTYTATISGKIEDIYGRPIGKDYSWSFSTLKPVATARLRRIEEKDTGRIEKEFGDSKGPVVIGHVPPDNGSMVDPATFISAEFSEPLLDFTVNSFTFRVNDGEKDIEGKIKYDNSRRTATFAPLKPLEKGRVYRVTLTKGIQDKAGNYLAEEYSWKFIVDAVWDTTGPRIVSVYPEDGVEEIPLDCTIRVRFNEKVQARSATPMNILVSDGKTRITGTCQISDDMQEITFQPVSPLQPNRVYIVNVTREIRDLAGNPLVEAKAWSFKTKYRAPVAQTKTNLTSVDSDFKSMEFISRQIGKTSATRIPGSKGETDIPVIEPPEVYADGMPSNVAMTSTDIRKITTMSDRSVGGYNTLRMDAEAATDAKRASDEIAGQKELMRRVSMSDRAVGGGVKLPPTDDDEPLLEGFGTTYPSGATTSTRITEDLTGPGGIPIVPSGRPVIDPGLGTPLTKDRLNQKNRLPSPGAGDTELPDFTGPSSESRTPRNKGVQNSEAAVTSNSIPYGVTPARGPSLESLPPGTAIVRGENGVETIENTGEAHTIIADGVRISGRETDNDWDRGNVSREFHNAVVEAVKNKAPLNISRDSSSRMNDRKDNGGNLTGSQGNLVASEVTSMNVRSGGGASKNSGNRNEEQASAGAASRTGAVTGVGAAISGVSKEKKAVTSERTPIVNEMDPSRLLVVAIYPNKNHVNVPVDAIITAVFNQPVDESTLNGLTFIMTSGNELVDGTVLYNPRMRKVIFRPDKPLEKGRTYEVTLTEGIRTPSGLNLLPLRWKFTTES